MRKVVPRIRAVDPRGQPTGDRPPPLDVILTLSLSKGPLDMGSIARFRADTPAQAVTVTSSTSRAPREAMK